MALVTRLDSEQSALMTSEIDPVISRGPSPVVTWIGDTHLRYEGWWIPASAVMSGRPLDVYTQTWPKKTATALTLFWMVDGIVSSSPMEVDLQDAGARHDNTQWKGTIPAEAFEAGRAVEYWIRAEDDARREQWDSNGGKNYVVIPRDEVTLFGPEVSVAWRMSGRGCFDVTDGTLVARPGNDLGLYWAAYPIPPAFELSLDFRLGAADDNSGVFLRFPEPDAFGYDNPAWVGVHFGLEVQIDETARPDGAPEHRTGAIYEQRGQTLAQRSAAPPGQWSRYVIRVVAQTYSVELDGYRVAHLAWPGDPVRPERALPGGPGAPRFVGVQAHTGAVAFRDVKLRRL